MAKHQVKFYVDDNEKRRLEELAKLRFMTVPNYAKVTALGVQIRQVKEVFVEKENFEYQETEEKILTGDEIILKAEDKAFLEEITKRYDKKRQSLQCDSDFNERLFQFAQKYLERG